VSLTNAGDANVTIGIGGTLKLFSETGKVRFQAQGVTAGTPVQVTGKAMNGASVLEAATAASTVIDNAAAVAATFTASTETKKIEMTTSPAGTTLTAGIAGANLVQLGKIAFTGTGRKDLDVTGILGETTVSTGAPAFGTDLTVTITPATGSFTAKQGFGLYTAANCTGALTGGVATTQTLAPLATAITAATTSAKITVASNLAASLAADVGSLFVCADYSGLTAGTVINTFKPSITATYTKSSTAYLDVTLAANNGYDLITNGTTKDLRNYVPAAQAGYTGYARVINTGTVSATIYVAVIDQATGTVGTKLGNLGTLAAGAATSFTSKQIEDALVAAGAPVIAASDRPRLRFTAATGSLDVQSFLANPGGVVSDMTGAQ